MFQPKKMDFYIQKWTHKYTGIKESGGLDTQELHSTQHFLAFCYVIFVLLAFSNLWHITVEVLFINVDMKCFVWQYVSTVLMLLSNIYSAHDRISYQLSKVLLNMNEIRQKNDNSS
jgi:hypothetical protein